MKNMYRFNLQPVVVILILLPAAVESAGGNVEFWTTNATLTCPQKGKWFLKGASTALQENGETYEFEYKGRNTYYCEYGTDKYFFYVEGKTCSNCFELDATLFMGILLANMALTVVVMLIIYKCTKRKMAGAMTKALARSGAPPTPSRDYEELNPRTRSRDTYALVNRTG